MDKHESPSLRCTASSGRTRREAEEKKVKRGSTISYASLAAAPRAQVGQSTRCTDPIRLHPARIALRMLRHAASSIRLQASRSPRSALLLRPNAARLSALKTGQTARATAPRRAFAATAWRGEEEGKPAPPAPLPAKFSMSEADKGRLLRLRNVGISAHIDSGASERQMAMRSSRSTMSVRLELTSFMARRQDDPDGTHSVLHRPRVGDPRGPRTRRCRRQDGLDGTRA